MLLSRYDAVLSALDAGVVVHGVDTAILEANDRARVLLGLHDLEGRLATDPTWVFLEADRSPMTLERFPVMQVITSRQPMRGLLTIVCPPNAPEVWLEVNAVPLLDANGDLAEIAVTFIDVTETRSVADALFRSEHTFRLAMDGAPQGMAVVGLALDFRQVNPALCAMLGRDEAWLLSHTMRDVIPEDDVAADLAARAELLSGAALTRTYEIRLSRADGSVLWALHSTALLRDDLDRPLYFVAQIQDNTDAHLITEELTHRANHDPLTGLINRDGVLDHLTHLLTHLGAAGGGPAVLFCDLDYFKSVNDEYGHAAGDEVLRMAAHRIASTLRLSDVAARLGGDEFVVVLDAIPAQAAAESVADKIRRAIAEPIPIGEGRSIHITASVGVVLATPDADAHRLLRNADAALYEAKDAGRDRVSTFHDTPRSTAAVDLRAGIRAGQLLPWFQPIVRLPDGAVVGYEALARWIRPDGSIVGPSDFLPIAERNNLITELDRSILDQSLDALSHLPPPLFVAINVSGASLGADDFAARVIESLSRWGADPSRVHLEFTESALLGVTTSVRQTMTNLADIGVRWYVDDFGTGYSSVSHLRDLPITGLKLDQSFTAQLGSDDPACRHLSQALAGLADGLRLDTVAEGVETEVHSAVLAAHGWKHGQGWLYGHPAPGAMLPGGGR